MALGALPTLTEINTELGTTGQALSTCVTNAGKTGVWDRQSDFAFYSNASGPSEVFTTALADGKEHLDHVATSWATVRSDTNGVVNSYCYYRAAYDGLYYYIGRSVLRFDFLGETSDTITAAKLILPKETEYTMVDSCYAYELPNDNALVTGDYSNFSTLYSDKGTIVSQVQEVALNAAGIAAFQAALDAGGIVTIMLLHENDQENNTPTSNVSLHRLDYATCKIELTY